MQQHSGQGAEHGDLDAVVIGAGASGLAAARMLAVKGLQVAVVEARDRVGGRTYSKADAQGRSIDLGGQWLAPQHHRAIALADELAISRYPQYVAGENILLLRGKRRRFKGSIPKLSPWALINLQLALIRLERMAASLSVTEPMAHKKARRWDQLTVAEWLRQNVYSGAARRVMELTVEAVLAAQPEDVSFLFYLRYCASAGGVERLLEVEGGAQEQRIAGGAQGLSEGLARLAKQSGADIYLNQPVQQLAWGNDGCEVRTAEHTLRCKRVIIAMAPAASNKLNIQPALPRSWTEWAKRMPMGSVIKCVVQYPQPFWREQGFSGEMFGDSGPLRMCFDGGAPTDSHGTLVGFITGTAATHWSDRGASARQDAVVQQLAGLFGEPLAQPSDYFDKDWCADEWSEGCYGGVAVPGALTRTEILPNQPCGRLHFAGTEMAEQWTGYIEGALQSGERAAQEVLLRC